MDTRYRLGGLICLVAAALVGWQAIWLPLRQASLEAATVSWVPRASVVVALCGVFGLYFLITGNRYPYRDAARQTLTPAGWALLAVVAIASFASYFGMASTLRAAGYS